MHYSNKNISTLKKKFSIGLCSFILLAHPISPLAAENDYIDSGYKFLTPHKYDSIQQSVGDIVVAIVNGRAGAETIKSDSANDVKVMTGVGNDKFNPRGTYSREQAIMTLLRLYN